MFLCVCVCVFFSFSLLRGICCGYSFELHQQVDAIQIGTHNISLYKVADKKYTGCDLKTTELLDCVLIGACAVIRSNMVRLVQEYLIILGHFSSFHPYMSLIFCRMRKVAPVS